MQLPHLANKPSAQFWMLSLFLFIVFGLGGSSRLDTQSLAILSPLSIIACGIAAVSLQRVDLEGRRWLFFWVAAVGILLAIHVVALPTELLPTRALSDEVFSKALLVESSTAWRPLTFTPSNGWATLVSLSVPLAVIAFGVQLSSDDLFRLLFPIVGLGVISGLIGLLQIIGSSDGPLYFYRITDPGSAVGLFANRNHASVFLACLFPALAVLASTGSSRSKVISTRSVFAVAIALILFPLILVTGSRLGLLVAVAGLGGGFLLYRPPVQKAALKPVGVSIRNHAAPLLAASAVLCLSALTLFFSRAVAIERFSGAEFSDDGRIAILTGLQNIFWTYFPMGSGSGSFAETFIISEPTQLLEVTYWNHAHNDWLEIAITMGVPGLLVLIIGGMLYGWRMYAIFLADPSRQSTMFSRMAGINLALFAIACISDYPLRTPAFMALAALFLLWLSEPPRKLLER